MLSRQRRLSVVKATLILLLIASGQLLASDAITFHGKVIDQYGVPVVDAAVEYHAHPRYMSGGSGFGKTRTDHNGIFAILNARGAGLTINRVSKPGYRIVLSRAGTRAIFSDNDSSPADRTWRALHAANPHVFKAWKLDKKPRLKTYQSLVGFKPDGTKHTLDFLPSQEQTFRRPDGTTISYINPGFQGLVKTEGAGKGDLLITIDRNTETAEVVIAVINGGIQEARDYEMYTAPDNNYQNSVRYTYDRRNRKFISSGNYYLKLRGGKHYGKLSLHISPFYNDQSGAIQMSYVINEDGTRVLTASETEPYLGLGTFVQP